MHKYLTKMKTTLCLILSLLTIILNVPVVTYATTSASTSNLVNAGFETGDLTGWTKGTVIDSAKVISSDSFQFAHDGNYMLRLGTATSSASISQPRGNNEVYQDFIAQTDSIKFSYNVYLYDYIGYDEFTYKLIDNSTGQVLKAYTQPGWGPDMNTDLKTTGWVAVNLDISQYKGKNLRLYFNCAGTRDDAYACWTYIDFGAQESKGSIVVNVPNNSTTEGDAGVPLNVTLDKQPQADVEVTVQPDSQLTVNPTKLVFTPDNWNVPQSVVATAKDDNIFEGNRFGNITFSATSSDSNFSDISAKSSIFINDNDPDLSGYYTVSADVSSGEGTVSPQVQQIKAGGSASIQIKPEDGYSAFVSDNGVNVTEKVTQNTYSLTNVNAHHAIKVDFVTSTPPKVLYTNPLNGATGVYKDCSIVAKFSEPVDKADDFNNIKVYNASGKEVAITSTLDGDKLTLKPISYLNGNSVYKVVIPKLAIKDSNAKTLLDDYVFSFTTKDAFGGPTVNTLTVSPATASVIPSQTQQLNVTANMSDGTKKDVTNSSNGTIYTSSDTSVATVDANGLVTVSGSATVG
ncbi:Ig-like domain-containing protein, partial [uncultured Clostridium sp.]|uniref:Ig-like domain-containing protein n=1 Tax=uncultured Clostridium sp. TaxID=59620 RepID=UPI0028EBD675